MTTTISEFSKLLLSIYGKAQSLPIAQFQDAILEDIKPYLGFDSAMWGTATMTNCGIDIHNIHLHRSSQAMLEAYAQVKHLDTSAMRVTQQPTATISFSAEADYASAASRPFRDFLVQFGHEHGLITSDIHPVSRFVHWVSLFRARASHVCTAQDLHILEYLAPHLMQALAINRLVHLDQLTGDVSREKWSVAIVDSRGVVYHADSRFLALVQAEWAMPDPDRLPSALVSALQPPSNRVVAQQLVLHSAQDHGLLYLKARARCAVDALSSREFLVAQMLASGLSQKEVAGKLGRSPHTINTQIKTCFEKLNITSVSQLAEHLVLR